MLTTLAILFVLGLLGAIVYGFGIVMRAAPSKDEIDMRQCSVCRKRYPKHLVIEREIGDSKVLHFCKPCVAGLAMDAERLPTQS